jgi:hypothetical protein
MNLNIHLSIDDRYVWEGLYNSVSTTRPLFYLNWNVCLVTKRLLLNWPILVLAFQPAADKQYWAFEVDQVWSGSHGYLVQEMLQVHQSLFSKRWTMHALDYKYTLSLVKPVMWWSNHQAPWHQADVSLEFRKYPGAWIRVAVLWTGNSTVIIQTSIFEIQISNFQFLND